LHPTSLVVVAMGHGPEDLRILGRRCGNDCQWL
jgi:hypothetical protein